MPDTRQTVNPSDKNFFLPHARQALALAKKTAETRHEKLIEPLHLMLALCDTTESLASFILREYGLDHDTLLKALNILIVNRQKFYEKPSLSKDSKRALNIAMEEAQFFSQTRISTGMLLMGILRLDNWHVEEALKASRVKSEDLWDRTRWLTRDNITKQGAYRLGGQPEGFTTRLWTTLGFNPNSNPLKSVQPPDESDPDSLYRWEKKTGPGYLPEAIKAFNEAIRLNNSKDINGALELLNKAIELQPKFFEAYAMRAHARFNLKDYDGVLSDASEAIQMQPDYAPAYVQRALGHFSLKNYEDSVRDWTVAIHLSPDDALKYINRAAALLNLKEYERALPDCDEAIRRKPDVWEAYNNRVEVHYHLKNYKQALIDIDQVLRLRPYSGQSHARRGDICFCLRDYDSAVSSYTQAIHYKFNLAAIHHARGKSYANMNRYPEALDDCNEAIRLNPELMQAYLSRGSAYANLGDLKSALANYDKAQGLDSDYAFLYGMRAFTYMHYDQQDRALENIETALKLDDKLTAAYQARGYIRADRNDLDGAQADFETLIPLLPESSAPINGMAWVALLRGDFDKTITLATQAIAFSAYNGYSFYLRGTAYARKGYTLPAIIDYREAQRLMLQQTPRTLRQVREINDYLAEWDKPESSEPKSET